MTTIAYRDGIMAADSQVTGNELRRGAATKLTRLADGGVLGTCGASGFGPMIAVWLNAGAVYADRPQMPPETNVWGIIARPDGTVVILSKEFVLQTVEAPFHSQGSGNEIALGAMAMGADAVRAVEIAAMFDVNTGGPVIFMPVGE